ncbi:hypothetical protein R1sor_000274 [Riccia sorocarpa]|uniref:Uncharacterized protein n=1 Tax=Riccia sorocarpa TaxID=122646 RepID=A0ABD3GVP5_9MARC
MATWEHDDLLRKGKGGVQDISDDIGTNEKYSEALSSLRFKLLLEKKSQSSMWTSTSGEGSKKQKGKAPVKKLNVVGVVTPKKATTGTVEAPKLKMGPTREPSKPKKGTPGVTPELQASKLISGTSADTTGKKTRTVKFIRLTKPPSTLPSKVGSSSRRTSSTANAPEADNTRSSPEQSVQPPTSGEKVKTPVTGEPPSRMR